MNETDKAIRDLYRGDGGPLSSYDEGWNDGVEAAEKAIRAELAAIKAAQPEYMCPNCVTPWKCNGHIPEHTIKAAQEDA